MTNPDPPVSLEEVFTARTATTLGLKWSNGASNGGSVIIDYSFY